MRFVRDRRGQSVVVGTVILFGFLILALSLYQAQVVPQQNAQVEFQHFEEVRNDLVDLRAGVLQAGSTDRTQYETVRLGTAYPTRVFAINPPAPAGTIQTRDAHNIIIAHASNGTVIETIPTRFIQYQPGYNEIDQSPTWYDASVLYLDARDEGGGIAVIEEHELVNEAGEVRVLALQNEFRRSGTGRVTLELRPVEGVTGTLPEGDLAVTVPTRLSGEEYWDDADVPSDVYGGVTDEPNEDGIYNLTLNTTIDNLTVDTVGVQGPPEEPTQVDREDDPRDDPNGGDTEIDVRIDDLTHANENRGRFLTSFEVKNAGPDFERVEVEYDYLSGGGGDQTESITDTRGRSEYVNGGTSGGQFDITLTAIGSDGGGGEFSIASRTITTTADANNPVEDDLGTGGSSFESVTFDDRSNPGQGPRYRIEYTVNDASDFDRVEGHLVSVSPNSGGRDERQSTAVSDQIELNTYGLNSEFKLVALTVDNDGVVIDAEITRDEADGTDPN